MACACLGWGEIAAAAAEMKSQRSPKLPKYGARGNPHASADRYFGAPPSLVPRSRELRGATPARAAPGHLGTPHVSSGEEKKKK